MSKIFITVHNAKIEIKTRIINFYLINICYIMLLIVELIWNFKYYIIFTYMFPLSNKLLHLFQLSKNNFIKV